MGIAKDNAAYRFAEMPEVDGAMIVESGSNSDGEWTRWADGTQICRMVASLTYAINAAWGSGYVSSSASAGTWPQAFVGVPSRTITNRTGSAASVLSGLGSQTSTDGGEFQLMRMVSVSASLRVTDIIGYGYWK